jgi:hypothetical protein
LQVWDTAARRGGSSLQLIDELAAAIAAAESALRQSTEGALLIMVSEMCDIGHLDEGQVQRLMEDEVQQTNIQVLDNRCALPESFSCTQFNMSRLDSCNTTCSWQLVAATAAAAAAARTQ